MSAAEMPVYLIEYDPIWPQMFSAEAAAIYGALAPDVIAVEHIGSTAIPGMKSKPVIDIMVLIEDITKAPNYMARLEALNYHYYPYALDRTPERRWFCKPGLEYRTHHLHLVQAGTEFHREHLQFRDYLVRHADVAAEYLALKVTLAERFPDDREAYTEGKTEFIRGVLARAGTEGNPQRMIARIWNGWTAPERADEYERLLRETIFPGIEAKEVSGYLGIRLLRRPIETGEIEFTTIMWFDALDDVKAFAGEDYETAYVPSSARDVLSRFDARSRHLEVRASIDY